MRLSLGRLVPIIAIALAAVLAACDAAEPAPPGNGGGSHPQTLAGTSWSVVSVAGRPPAPGAPPTVAFGDVAVRGSGGCNQYGAGYQYEPSTGRILFAMDGGMTAMACLENDRMTFETAFIQALLGAQQADLDAGRHLVLSGPAGAIVLTAMLEG